MTTHTEFVPIEEAAARLGVSRDAIYREFRARPDGTVKAARFGGDRFGQRCIIRRAPFERYMAGLDIEAPAPAGPNPFIRRDLTLVS